MLQRLVKEALLVCVIVLNAVPGQGTAIGQVYPSKPIRIITAEVGGSPDFISRVIAEAASNPLGQMIVENRGGAGGILAAQTVAKAPPDGYTLLLYGSPFWLLPFLQDNVPYDPVKEFLPVTLTNRAPNVLVVNPSLPVKSVKEIIALAKAKPGELNYASGATGSSNHLAAELFKAMARLNIVRVAYKGSGPAMSDLVSGQVQLAFFTPTSVMRHVKSGRLRALAVTSAQPSALTPGLPTMAASGLPGYESASVYGVFAPAQTSSFIINRLNQEIVRVLNDADIKERFAFAGSEVVASSPQQLMSTMKSEMSSMGKLIKDAGIRAD